MESRKASHPSSSAQGPLDSSTGPESSSYVQRRASQRRTSDQPRPSSLVSKESPVTSSAFTSTNPRGYTQPTPSNGLSRSASHRRRYSQNYSHLSDANRASLPPAPDVPSTSESRSESRRAPPLSYRDPYISTSGSRSRRHSLSQSGAPSRPTVRIPADHGRRLSESERRHVSTGSVPGGGPSKISGTGAPLLGTRRPSVPERSPLQKLEVTLDDISKEEKRYRLEEAEMLAQERLAAAQAARRASRDVAAATGQLRNASGPERASGSSLTRSESTRRQSLSGANSVREKRQADPSAASDSKRQGQVEDTPRGTSGATTSITASGSQRRASRQPGFQEAPPTGSDVGPKRQSSITRGGSFRERSAVVGKRADESSVVSQRGAPAGSEVSTATGLGLYGVEQSNLTQRDIKVSRSESRRLNKNLPHEPTKSSGDTLVARSVVSRATRSELDHDPLPREAVLLNKKPTGPKYEIPPQTAAGQRAREQVGFGGDQENELHESQSSHQSRLHSIFRGRDGERRYNTPKPLDEWKNAPIATLTLEDMDLDAPNPDDKKAWWERGGGSQRRKSTSKAPPAEDPTLSYGNAQGKREGQTTFSPALYLECGPLLRYTGIRKETRTSGRVRHMWRGTVMIVTQDDRSKYESRPFLRLFSQPLDLLPPPPAQIDQASGQKLAAEYVDPLAGQVKMSRSGKTLYVKPVEELEEQADLSRVENDNGLFWELRTATDQKKAPRKDGEQRGKFKEAKAIRLHTERGMTFWRFNIAVELGREQARIAYRINNGPAIGFWVPGKDQNMNIMFHSCNGFSLGTDANQFCGPDPMWRDVLNNHQTRPFHVMIGGGDQVYNDAATTETKLFQEWTRHKNPRYKHSASFTKEMQDELEDFYLRRYCMWFSQGLFGMAVSQIPMVNIWDDHDIIDGFGSYPHGFMSTAVFSGLGCVAQKYYLLFQQSCTNDETAEAEPSWVLGSSPGPYINQLSRSIFVSLGKDITFLGLDCRTERMRDSILTDDTYDIILDRCSAEIKKGETKHLIVLLGVPIAYPRLNFLENVLTSRVMDPIKALGRTGILGNFVNKFDGGVEILDDLDDHWTAKHHKSERNWFIEELQELAAEKSVRISILGGDVHLAAIGRFFSNAKLSIPRDRDHRYMPNIISSAIVNAPPPDLLADILNKRNKIHHFDAQTDEDMIPIFTHDVDGRPRNNNRLLPRRNWLSFREYIPGSTPPPSRPGSESTGPKLNRTLSNYTPGKLVRRLSRSGPPPSYYNNPANPLPPSDPRSRPQPSSRPASFDGSRSPTRPNVLQRRNSGTQSRSSMQLEPDVDRDMREVVDLNGGLEFVLNLEVNPHDPAGITTPYRLLVPALWYDGVPDMNPTEKPQRQGRVGAFFGGLMGRRRRRTDRDERDDWSDEEPGMESKRGSRILDPSQVPHIPPTDFKPQPKAQQPAPQPQPKSQPKSQPQTLPQPHTRQRVRDEDLEEKRTPSAAQKRLGIVPPSPTSRNPRYIGGGRYADEDDELDYTDSERSVTPPPLDSKDNKSRRTSWRLWK